VQQLSSPRPAPAKFAPVRTRRGMRTSLASFVGPLSRYVGRGWSALCREGRRAVPPADAKAGRACCHLGANRGCRSRGATVHTPHVLFFAPCEAALSSWGTEQDRLLAVRSPLSMRLVNLPHWRQISRKLGEFAGRKLS